MSLPSWLAGSNPRRTAIRSVVLIVVAVVLFGVVLLPVRGFGPSMIPTIEQGDMLYVNRLAYKFREPRRAEIVAVRIGRGTSAVYIKRLVAIPGDRVAIEDGVLMIDGLAVEEPYVVHRSPDWQLAPTTLGPDEYFVVGDNRSMPMRQHDMGTATRARLIGPTAIGPL